MPPTPSPHIVSQGGFPIERAGVFCHEQAFRSNRGPPTSLTGKFARDSLLADHASSFNISDTHRHTLQSHPTPCVMKASTSGRISVPFVASPQTAAATDAASALSWLSGEPCLRQWFIWSCNHPGGRVRSSRTSAGRVREPFIVATRPGAARRSRSSSSEADSPGPRSAESGWLRGPTSVAPLTPLVLGPLNISSLFWLI